MKGEQRMEDNISELMKKAQEEAFMEGYEYAVQILQESMRKRESEWSENK